MKKASFLIISMNLLLFAAPAVSHASLSENFSQYDQGFPTDPRIVQASVFHGDGGRLVQSIVNLDEGGLAVSPQVGSRVQSTMEAGSTTIHRSDGTSEAFRNDILKVLLPNPEYSMTSVVVIEGKVDLHTRYGMTTVKAANRGDYESSNFASVSYAPPEIKNYPEVSEYKGDRNTPMMNVLELGSNPISAAIAAFEDRMISDIQET